MNQPRSELVYVRTLLFWPCWALGVIRSTTRPLIAGDRLIKRRFELVTFCLGPLRFQFLDWGKRWRFQRGQA